MTQVIREPIMDAQEAGRKIDELVKEYMYQHPQISYQLALQKVLDRYPELKKAYALGAIFPGKSHFEDEGENTKRNLDFYIDGPPKDEDPRVEVDRHTRNMMAFMGSTDYQKCMNMVFAERPDLKERYAKS